MDLVADQVLPVDKQLQQDFSSKNYHFLVISENDLFFQIREKKGFTRMIYPFLIPFWSAVILVICFFGQEKQIWN